MDAQSFPNQLLPGERLTWEGRPGQGILFVGRDIFLIPFGLLWCGFAVFWEAATFSNQHTPIFFRLWGIPFILLGLYFVFGRFLFDAYLRRRLTYAVTNQRILISGPRPFSTLTILRLDRLPELRLKDGANGRGTLYFGPQISSSRRNGFAVWTPSLDDTPQFIDIENAQSVFSQIQRTQHA